MALTDHNEKKAEKREKPLTKVIIRRLPPLMDQETFINHVSPIPDYNYIYLVKGDVGLGENAFSRVYVNFVCPEDVYSFKERFDNYVFLDNKGHEYPAVVEFSPFQKIPKKRGKSKIDPKCGTLESDPYYLEFIENLNKPQEPEKKPEYTLQLNHENKDDVSTPLLEYIKNKRAQKMKIREMRREERKRREFDRKKEYGKSYGYEEKTRDNEEKSQVKHHPSKSASQKYGYSKERTDTFTEKNKMDGDEKPDRSEKPSYFKNKDRKYDEKRKEIKPRFPRREYSDNRDFKRGDEFKDKEFRNRAEESKKDDSKVFTKKVKKYSEKREERKMEAQKAEQKRLEQQNKDTKENDVSNVVDTVDTAKLEKQYVNKEKSTEPVKTGKHYSEKDDQTEIDNVKETNIKSYESESNSSKRIRNKDRPTIALYRPGMLSKRKQNDGDDTKT